MPWFSRSQRARVDVRRPLKGARDDRQCAHRGRSRSSPAASRLRRPVSDARARQASTSVMRVVEAGRAPHHSGSCEVSLRVDVTVVAGRTRFKPARGGGGAVKTRARDLSPRTAQQASVKNNETDGDRRGVRGRPFARGDPRARGRRRQGVGSRLCAGRFGMGRAGETPGPVDDHPARPPAARLAHRAPGARAVARGRRAGAGVLASAWACTEPR